MHSSCGYGMSSDVVWDDCYVGQGGITLIGAAAGALVGLLVGIQETGEAELRVAPAPYRPEALAIGLRLPVRQ